jgi:hypothetical protein
MSLRLGSQPQELIEELIQSHSFTAPERKADFRPILRMIRPTPALSRRTTASSSSTIQRRPADESQPAAANLHDPTRERYRRQSSKPSLGSRALSRVRAMPAAGSSRAADGVKTAAQ